MRIRVRVTESQMHSLRGQYHFLPLVTKLKAENWTNERIAELLDCSISTVKYIVRMAPTTSDNDIDLGLGDVDPERMRIAAVYACMEYLAIRGWQVAESDAKCVYDVFGIKDDKTVKIQVRSSNRVGGRGWPLFKACRIQFNTKRIRRVSFQLGDFDYWFFYSKSGAWMVPFAEVVAAAEFSIEGFDKYRIR